MNSYTTQSCDIIPDKFYYYLFKKEKKSISIYDIVQQVNLSTVHHTIPKNLTINVLIWIE